MNLETALQTALEALAHGKAVAPSVAEAWGFYAREHVERRLAPSGKAMARYSWQNLRCHFGDLRIPRVNQVVVNAYEDARREGAIGRPSKPVTIRRELAYLRAALNFAGKHRMVSKDDIHPFDLPANATPRQGWARLETVQALLDAAAAQRRQDGRLTKLERFIWLGLETAARKTAILHLTWDRVDFDLGVINFNEAGRLETRKRRTTVPISSSLRPVLERAHTERISKFVLDNTNDGVWKAMQIAAQRAGLASGSTAKGKCPSSAGISPHMLRHAAATLMARDGVPLFDVAGVLANSLPVVEKVYAHQAPQDSSRTVDRISKGRLRQPK